MDIDSKTRGRWSRPVVLLVLLLGVLVVTACSRTELFYRNADWFAYRWVDGLLDAEAQQDQRWSAVLETVAQRHREELLVDVVAWLDATSAQVSAPQSEAGLRCLWDAGEQVLEAHARLLVEPAVAILSDVSARQVEHLAEELDERNASYRERLLHPDAAEREAARVERFSERIERWTGDLDGPQRELVAQAVADMPDIADEWFDYRASQQQRLLDLLRRQAPPAEVRSFLRDWWVEQEGRPAALDDGYVALKQGWIAMLMALDDTLDEGQREHLRDRVDELRNDLAGELDTTGDGYSRVGHSRYGLPCTTPI